MPVLFNGRFVVLIEVDVPRQGVPTIRRWRGPFPRWYHGLPATRHLSWARFGRLVLILLLYHNYTSCIASSSLDYVWLTCQHVINSLVRICFRRLHVLDMAVPVRGMDISTLPAAVFLWSIFICITVWWLLAISSDNSRVFTLTIFIPSFPQLFPSDFCRGCLFVICKFAHITGRQ